MRVFEGWKGIIIGDGEGEGMGGRKEYCDKVLYVG
jgi:hypothetical protein